MIVFERLGDRMGPTQRRSPGKPGWEGTLFELLQWLILIVLGVAIGALSRRRGGDRLPEWLRDASQDEFVTQSELDRYHHRVLHLFQTQRELVEAKIDGLAKPRKGLGTAARGDATRGSEPESTRQQTPEPVPDEESRASDSEKGAPPAEIPSAEEMDAAHQEPSPAWGRVLQDEPTKEVSFQARPPCPPQVESPSSATRVLSMWTEGRSIDEIARELRMGRQEVQLLVEMSRRRPFIPSGV